MMFSRNLNESNFNNLYEYYYEWLDWCFVFNCVINELLFSVVFFLLIFTKKDNFGKLIELMMTTSWWGFLRNLSPNFCDDTLIFFKKILDPFWDVCRSDVHEIQMVWVRFLAVIPFSAVLAQFETFLEDYTKEKKNLKILVTHSLNIWKVIKDQNTLK